MANVLYIPFLNSINFYEVSPAQFDQYLTKYMDDYRFSESIPIWMEPMQYEQKIQKTDITPIQMESNFEPLQLDVINKYGNVVTTLVANYQLPNKYIPGVFAYQFMLSWSSLPVGNYYLRLTNGNPAELHMISNPICLKEKHEYTVLHEYRNSRYHLDVMFETGITFQFRVEGSFDFLKPGANITAYEDQKANPYILSARPFRIWPLVYGGTFGLPDWVADKLNLIWSCNDVRVDGKSFARSGESQLSFNEIEGYPMRGITIELREGVNRGSKIVSPTLDPNKKLLVAFNLNPGLFGDLSENAANNTVQIFTTY